MELGEQRPDLAVDVAEEVHVGGAAVQPLVLHQQLPEQHLQLVLVAHDLQLREDRRT